MRRRASISPTLFLGTPSHRGRRARRRGLGTTTMPATPRRFPCTAGTARGRTARRMSSPTSTRPRAKAVAARGRAAAPATRTRPTGSAVEFARDKASFPSGVKTSFYCGHELSGRAVPLCRDGSGHHSRSCFEVHILSAPAVASACKTKAPAAKLFKQGPGTALCCRAQL